MLETFYLFSNLVLHIQLTYPELSSGYHTLVCISIIQSLCFQTPFRLLPNLQHAPTSILRIPLAGRRRGPLELAVVHVRLVLFRLLVRDEQLAVLAVAAGLVARHVDDLEVGGGAVHFVEDGVHLLERPVRRLRVEEVDARHHEGVDDGEDDVRLVLDRVEGDRRDHDDHEVEDPVAYTYTD